MKCKCNLQQPPVLWGHGKIYSRPPACWLARRHGGAASRRKREQCSVEVQETAEFASTSDAGVAPSGSKDSEVQWDADTDGSTRQLSERGAGPSNGTVGQRERRWDFDEAAPERFPHHRRLYSAAKAGDVEGAEAVLQEMSAAELLPGPRAYHALVVAHAKAGDADGALSAVQRGYTALYDLGLQPMPETYVVLIHANVAAGEVERAEAVYSSMQRQGYDARCGWLMLTCELFRRGYPHEALRYVEQGRLEHGWEPNGDIYELLISWLCALARSAPRSFYQHEHIEGDVAVFGETDSPEDLDTKMPWVHELSWIQEPEWPYWRLRKDKVDEDDPTWEPMGQIYAGDRHAIDYDASEDLSVTGSYDTRQAMNLVEYLLFTKIPEQGVPLEPRIYNPFLRALARSPVLAMDQLEEIATGRYGAASRPNVETYNCMIEAALDGVLRGKRQPHDFLPIYKAELIDAGLLPNKRTHALLAEYGLMPGLEEEVGMWEYEEMVKLAAPGAVLAHFRDNGVFHMIRITSFNKWWRDLLGLLKHMSNEGRVLPRAALAVTEDGFSYFGAWLRGGDTLARILDPVKGLAVEKGVGVALEGAQPAPLRMVDGQLIGQDNSCVFEGGVVMPVSRLGVPQLRAELAARGLPVNGLRNTLYRRVQAARRASTSNTAAEIAELARRERVELKLAHQKEINKEVLMWYKEELLYGRARARARREKARSFSVLDSDDDDSDEEELLLGADDEDDDIAAGKKNAGPVAGFDDDADEEEEEEEEAAVVAEEEEDEDEDDDQNNLEEDDEDVTEEDDEEPEDEDEDAEEPARIAVSSAKEVDAARRTARLRELRAEVEAEDKAWSDVTPPVGREAWYPADRGLCEAALEVAELAEALCPVPPAAGLEPGPELTPDGSPAPPRTATVPTAEDWAMIALIADLERNTAVRERAAEKLRRLEALNVAAQPPSAELLAAEQAELDNLTEMLSLENSLKWVGATEPS
ncbi:hypothetical protein WJX81_004550 [Elliptochloris bilobata]|uniref:SAP domain-containing protein n=1 Tax=Elliptochloris bilobata TaxID=381761 RepID=A0AAW1SBV4_9CHLO